MGNEEKEYKGYFHPWKGMHSEDGIIGTTILIIGVQHWCDPEFWNCKEDKAPHKCLEKQDEYTNPHECLKKRDQTCTVWNKTKNKEMKLCPLKAVCQEKKDNGGLKLPDERCLVGDFRYLHCETKISTYDHIKGNIKRAQVFECLSDALNTLFKKELKGLKEEEKFERIVFANYIQHYTKFYRCGRLDDNELGVNPANDKKGFERNFRLFEEKRPDVIIVLQNEKILKEVESILNERYKKKHYIHLQEKDRPEYYYVLAQISSKFYKQYRDGIENFIENYIDEELTKEHEKKKITRMIEALVLFLLKKDDYKLKSRRILEQMIVDKCSSRNLMIVDKCSSRNLKYKDVYYKDGKFNDQPFRDLRRNNPNTPEEEKRVKDKYDADMGNKK